VPFQVVPVTIFTLLFLVLTKKKGLCNGTWFIRRSHDIPIQFSTTELLLFDYNLSQAKEEQITCSLDRKSVPTAIKKPSNLDFFDSALGLQVDNSDSPVPVL
jgi:hypothetical protein